MSTKQLKEKEGKLGQLQDELSKAFEEARQTEDGTLDLSKVKALGEELSARQVAEEISRRNKELEELGKELDSLRAVDDAYQKAQSASSIVHPGGEQKSEPEPQTVGEKVTASPIYKAWREGDRSQPISIDYGLKELKTLFETGTGWAPESTRTGTVIDATTRPVQVIDLFPSGQTGQAAVIYMEETTRTHAAAEMSEGATFPEAEFALSEKSEPVRKVGTSIPVTDEQLEDVAMVQSYLDNRLRFGLRQRLDNQLLNGDGIAPNLEGILNRTGLQSLSKASGDSIPDTIFKSMRTIRVSGRAQPNQIIMHPEDWEKVRLLQTSDGVYIWGPPMDQGPERMWGLPVTQADSLTTGTAVVGDFANFAQLFERRGIDMQMGFTGTQFTEGKQTMRADMRVALAIYRPGAFAEVTGL